MQPRQYAWQCPAAKSRQWGYACNRGTEQLWRSHYTATSKYWIAKHNGTTRNGLWNCTSKTGFRRQNLEKKRFWNIVLKCFETYLYLYLYLHLYLYLYPYLYLYLYPYIYIYTNIKKNINININRYISTRIFIGEKKKNEIQQRQKLRKFSDKLLSQPWCSHANTLDNVQLQKRMGLRMQPRHQTTLTQPTQFEIEILNRKTQ